LYIILKNFGARDRFILTTFYLKIELVAWSEGGGEEALSQYSFK